MTTKRWRIELRSEEFGAEHFDYDSMAEAIEGQSRLEVAAVASEKCDDIRRSVKYLGPVKVQLSSLS